MIESQSACKRRILIVDDEPGLVDIMTDVLSERDYQIVSTTDSRQALTLIKEQPFDLVITDLKMPNVDGIGVIEGLRQSQPQTDVVMVTGFGSLESAISALQQQVYDYILKPFNVKDILLTVDRVFQKRDLEHTNALLQEQVSENLSQLTTLYEIARFINSSENIQEVLQFTTETIATTIGLERFCFIMNADSKGDYRIKEAHGLDDESLERFSVKIGEGVIGKAIARGDVAFVENFHNDPHYAEGLSPADRDQVQGVLVVPLKAEADTFGALLAFDFEANTNDNDQKIQWLSVMVTQVSPIIKLFLQRETFTRLSRDPLIAVKRQMTSIVDRAVAYRGGLVFLFCRLYMKKTSGIPPNIVEIHDRIYSLLLRKVSSIDAVIVLGMDSFVVILQGQTRAQSELFGAEMKREVESMLSKNGEIPFSLDYGQSVFPYDGTNAEELISIAQQNIWKQVKQA